ncbi:hypothetical protein DFH07DRAFT_769819 [Mycena maculata]|uniref:Uncharacterized protein n=1 Tax=Mycena maculata TaxID=230809 RepID=A0AAD7JLJ8_9AGAR|nr:hypothetical protein DFH07DRAFT_769819 [Mycena maculata]
MFQKVEGSGGVGCKPAQAQVNARTSHTSQPTQIQTPLAAQVTLPSQSDIPHSCPIWIDAPLFAIGWTESQFVPMKIEFEYDSCRALHLESKQGHRREKDDHAGSLPGKTTSELTAQHIDGSLDFSQV